MALLRRKQAGRTDSSGNGAPAAPAMGSIGADGPEAEPAMAPEAELAMAAEPVTESEPVTEAEPPTAAKREKRAKAERPRAQRQPKASASSGLLAQVTYQGPSREEMEREAQAELQAALAISYDRLKSEVPDAGSLEEAQQRIESAATQKAVPDVDAGIPDHPVYSGDALVYQQLRRHYGAVHPGGSFRRSWYPLQPR